LPPTRNTCPRNYWPLCRHLAGVDRGRIGPILRPKNASRRLASPPIIAGPAGPRRRRDRRRNGETLTEADQHRIRDCLPRKRGAGGAKGHRSALIAAKGENGGDLILALDRHDDARRQPVETGVGPIGEQAQGIGTIRSDGKTEAKLRSSKAYRLFRAAWRGSLEVLVQSPLMVRSAVKAARLEPWAEATDLMSADDRDHPGRDILLDDHQNRKHQGQRDRVLEGAGEDHAFLVLRLVTATPVAMFCGDTILPSRRRTNWSRRTTPG